MLIGARRRLVRSGSAHRGRPYGGIAYGGYPGAGIAPGHAGMPHPGMAGGTAPGTAPGIAPANGMPGMGTPPG